MYYQVATLRGQVRCALWLVTSISSCFLHQHQQSCTYCTAHCATAVKCHATWVLHPTMSQHCQKGCQMCDPISVPVSQFSMPHATLFRGVLYKLPWLPHRLLYIRLLLVASTCCIWLYMCLPGCWLSNVTASNAYGMVTRCCRSSSPQQPILPPCDTCQEPSVRACRNDHSSLMHTHINAYHTWCQCVIQCAQWRSVALAGPLDACWVSEGCSRSTCEPCNSNSHVCMPAEGTCPLCGLLSVCWMHSILAGMSSLVDFSALHVKHARIRS